MDRITELDVVWIPSRTIVLQKSEERGDMESFKFRLSHLCPYSLLPTPYSPNLRTLVADALALAQQ
ncbi:MAG: hypothetical protein KME42_20350 [Tildeniella nuda ZEHNDER 1965/U140]|nr:hypothetical protein [Tildeniella nuda ZEHNDER 1965/U140]